MEQEPDYKELYQHAQLEMQNLKNQVLQWEMKASILRQLIEQQEEFATAIGLNVESFMIAALNMKKLGLR
jgi:hypothetical protein